MRYAKNKGLAGVMIWELDQDLQIGDTLANGTSVSRTVWENYSIVKGLADGK